MLLQDFDLFRRDARIALIGLLTQRRTDNSHPVVMATPFAKPRCVARALQPQ